MKKDDTKIDPVIRNVKKLFKESFVFQWVVPIYQRHYVWKSDEDDQIPGVWEDWKDQAEKLLNPDPKNPIRPHYFGAIIYSDNTVISGELPRRDLVDGQQRLTTFQLALVALREVAAINGYTKTNDIDSYILNIFNEDDKPTEPERYRYKLWPSKLDRPFFESIVYDTPQNGSGLTEAYNRFYENIDSFVKEKMAESENETIDNLIGKLKEALLDHFQVVLIRLGDDDDPQQIFASLNGKAEPLSPFDLVRNDIFYRARENGRNDKEAEQLFENEWDYFEKPFWEIKRGRGHSRKTHANHFIVDAVVAQTAKEINQRRIVAKYQEYIKDYSDKGYLKSVRDELDVLVRYGTTYRALSEKLTGADTDRIAHVLGIWDLASIIPLVLWIENIPKINLDEKKTLFLMIESYIIRRDICSLTTRSFTTIVPEILDKMHKAERHGDNIIKAFQGFLTKEDKDYKRMPTNDNISDACEQKVIYTNATSAKKLTYILKCIEGHVRNKNNEPIPMDGLNIEHIMPQHWAENWNLGKYGKVPSENFRDATRMNQELNTIAFQTLIEKRQGVINTIGNLTLLTPPFNSSIGNDSWDAKKARLKEESGLRLNSSIVKKAKWDEDTIKTRSAELAGYINKIWKHPSTE